MNTLLGLMVVLVGFFALSSFTFAQRVPPSCPSLFGGGEVCVVSQNLLVDIRVLNPSTNQMVEELSSHTPYPLGSLITFRITLSNREKDPISTITLSSILPQAVSFKTGDGVYDSSSRTVSIVVDRLNPKATKTFTLQGLIEGAFGKEPIVCVAQRVRAASLNAKSEDAVPFCVEKKAAQTRLPTVFPAPSTQRTPSTGPLPLLLLFLPLAGGIIFRKIA